MNQFNPKDTAERIVSFLKDEFSRSGFSRAVIGVSGGVDSATAFVLTVKALGGENVFPVLLPYGSLNTEGTLAAMNFVQPLLFQISQITRIDIKPAVDRVAEAAGPMDQLRRGNVMARIRMVYLFDQAKKRQALVVGTENKTEHLLGYFTRFGDEASDIEPLRSLYKTQVYTLARHLGIPESILAKPPSAGLWPGQTDEGEFGFTYEDADKILTLLYDGKKSIPEVVAAGFDPQTVEKVAKRMAENTFKHALPLVVK